MAPWLPCFRPPLWGAIRPRPIWHRRLRASRLPISQLKMAWISKKCQPVLLPSSKSLSTKLSCNSTSWRWQRRRQHQRAAKSKASEASLLQYRKSRQTAVVGVVRRAVPGMHGLLSRLRARSWPGGFCQDSCLNCRALLLQLSKYCKVASWNTSCLEAHAGFFRMEFFDPCKMNIWHSWQLKN